MYRSFISAVGQALPPAKRPQNHTISVGLKLHARPYLPSPVSTEISRPRRSDQPHAGTVDRQHWIREIQVIQHVGKRALHLDLDVFAKREALGQARVQVYRPRTRHTTDARVTETSDRIRVPRASNEARRTHLPSGSAR